MVQEKVAMAIPKPCENPGACQSTNHFLAGAGSGTSDAGSGQKPPREIMLVW